MPTYTVKHNAFGGIYEVRFKPSFLVGSQSYGQLGPQMMNHGNFFLEGWSWDSETGELSRYERDGITFDPKKEVERIDAMMSELLKQFTLWRSFEKINQEIKEGR